MTDPRETKIIMRPHFLILLLFLGWTNCNSNSSNKALISTDGNQQATNNSANALSVSAGSQTVTIDSPNGVKIVGSLFESAKANTPAVLLLHQWQSDRHSYDDFAKRLQAKGFNVLSIDGRGFGESVKTADGKTVAPERTDAAVKGMLGDVGAAFEFLSKQKNVDPATVGIVGASYGSSLAIIYAADNPKVKAVALLSPGLNYFGNMATEPAIAKYGNRPLLLVAAQDDTESADAVKKLSGNGSNEKYQVKIYDKGGHGTGLFGARVGLEDLLEEFLTKSLG
jgi:Dienelactone hydrolase and related enzymes